jgi:DNA replication protein DnaC
MRYELIVIDDGICSDAGSAAELLFRDRRPRRASGGIVTTNLPSLNDHNVSNARLCKAMLDRLTDQAHIIETGTESYRFRRTLAKKRCKAAADGRGTARGNREILSPHRTANNRL